MGHSAQYDRVYPDDTLQTKYQILLKVIDQFRIRGAKWIKNIVAVTFHRFAKQIAHISHQQARQTGNQLQQIDPATQPVPKPWYLPARQFAHDSNRIGIFVGILILCLPSQQIILPFFYRASICFVLWQPVHHMMLLCKE